jgi:hypothetical protein
MRFTLRHLFAVLTFCAGATWTVWECCWKPVFSQYTIPSAGDQWMAVAECLAWLAVWLVVSFILAGRPHPTKSGS